MHELVDDQEDRVRERENGEPGAEHRHPPQRRVGERDHGVEEVLELLGERPARPAVAEALLARHAVVGNERRRKASPDEETRQRDVDLAILVEEVDRGAADQEAVEAAGRHPGEREAAQRPVVHAGRGAGRPALRPAPTHGEDGGRAAAPRRHHLGKELRRLLQVGGQHRGRVAPGLAQPRGDRHLGAEVPRQPYAARRRPVPRDLFDALPRGVARAVVHEEGLDVEVRRSRDRAQPLGQAREAARVEVDGHDHADQGPAAHGVLFSSAPKKPRTASTTAETCASESVG